MEQSELAKIVALLRVAYPYHFKDWKKEDVFSMISIYKQQFKEFHIVSLTNAINVLIKVCKYVPSIAEIYEECQKQQCIFYKKILENNKSITSERKKYLLDMVDWYRVSSSNMPLEEINEIIGYYDDLKLQNKEVNLIGVGL